MEQLLGHARQGRGDACIVSGPPGIGKSALLTWAVSHADGFTTLQTGCAAQDAERAHCTLRGLLEPLDAQLPRLLPEHERALRGVLGRGPGTAIDGLAVGGALVGLLALLAEDAPVLVVVDDVHWIDPSSGQTLAFAAPRLGDEPVALLFATRDGETDPFRGRLPVMPLAGLSGLDAAELLAPTVRTSVAEELARATNGNPLAMLETAEQLSEEQCRGDVALPGTLHLGDVLLRGFLRRTETASDAERRILMLAAADAHLTLGQLREAATAAGSPPSALADVLRRDVLTVGRGDLVRFTHPLLGHAVYQHGSDDERRAAHTALAGVFTESDVDRKAWHLARSVDGPDPTAAAALVAAARTAGARSDHLAAGEALARAAELSTGPSRVQRFKEAGVAFADGGAADRARGCFDAALTLVDDAATRADITLERARPLLHEVGPAVLQRELLALTDDLDHDPERAALVTAVSGLLGFLMGDVTGAHDLCVRALAFPTGRDTVAATMASALLDIARVARGDVGEPAGAIVAQATALAATPLGPGTVGYADIVANALLWIEEFSVASHLLSTMVESARRLSAVSMLAFALVVRSDLYQRTGHWHAALADAVEADELSREGRIAPVAASLVERGRVEAGLGDLDDARDHATAGLDSAMRLGLGAAEYRARATLGFIELAAGRLRTAMTHLDTCREFARDRGVRLVTAAPWAPDLVEAAVRSDRADHAVEVVGMLARNGAAEQSPLARALFHRCRGLVAEGDYTGAFEAALDAHAAGRVPFEQARTELCFGERLRRDRRIRDARDHLERAAEAFAALGARTWLERAQHELGMRAPATGARGPVERLTPQQFRVAVAVGNGATNREAAAALFLSPRTVEQHLVRVYQTLGIHSRAELVRLVATDPEFAREPDDA